MKCVAQRILMIIVAGALGTMGTHAEAEVTPYQAEETARLIAALLSTGRVVIDRNQSLIDDPNKGAKGFTRQTNDNKILEPPYSACRAHDAERWIITAWTPCHRAWANGRSMLTV